MIIFKKKFFVFLVFLLLENTPTTHNTSILGMKGPVRMLNNFSQLIVRKTQFLYWFEFHVICILLVNRILVKSTNTISNKHQSSQPSQRILFKRFVNF